MITPILCVKDLVQSLAFYSKLGFQQQRVFAGPDGVMALVFLSLGENTLGLRRLSDVPATPHVDFMVSIPSGTELTAFYRQIKAQGLAVTEEITLQAWGERTLTVTDPDGYRIVLFQSSDMTDQGQKPVVRPQEARID